MAEQDATMPIEEIEQLIAEGYSWSEAANAVAGTHLSSMILFLALPPMILV